MTEYPWEPPLAGTEEEQLVGSLDRLRTTFRFMPTGSAPRACASGSARRR